MSIVWLIYFASIVQGVAVLLVFSAIVCLFVYVVWWVAFSDRLANSPPPFKFICSPIICLSLAVLLPSERVIYTMAGAYAVEQIATSDGAKQIGGKVLDLINQKLDSELSKGEK